MSGQREGVRKIEWIGGRRSENDGHRLSNHTVYPPVMEVNIIFRSRQPGSGGSMTQVGRVLILEIL